MLGNALAINNVDCKSNLNLSASDVFVERILNLLAILTRISTYFVIFKRLMCDCDLHEGNQYRIMRRSTFVSAIVGEHNCWDLDRLRPTLW